MWTQDMYTQRVPPPTQAPTGTTIGRGILQRWRERNTEREPRRLVSARHRRVLARWLRRTARGTQEPHPIDRRRQALLHYRASAVSSELLEIAAALERAHDPDPARVALLHELLANGCDSPLYNPDIHVSELRATLHHVRAGLVTPA